jgi:cell division transport system permease protein
MRLLYVLRYFFQEAASNLWSNRLNNIISVGIISFSLFTLGLFMLTAQNLSRLMGSWTEEVQVNLFLQKEVPRDKLSQLESIIKMSPCVAGYHFVSQQEALQRFRRYYPNMSRLTEELNTNPFPPSYEISIRKEFQSKAAVQDLVSRLRLERYVQDVEYDQDWIDRVQFIIKFLQIVGLFFGGILLSTSIFSISNVIKLMVVSRKDEIEIMKLVGATNGFIKGPFLTEGMLQGLIGGGIAISLLYAIFQAVLLKVNALNAPFFSANQLQFLLPSISASIITGGMSVGFLGSYISLGKLLRI